MERIAHYRIVSPLGKGGMGEVYLADDERLLRRVALKVITSDAEDSRRRFLREAHAASALSHPNVAHIYDIGTDDGVDYIAMEYIEGETLAARLARRSLSVDEILQMAVQLADAIAAAHERGIIHRDIKPSNVMLAARDQVKVLDFGLAKLDPAAEQISADSDTAPQTRSGIVLGTTHYMSPEQALGRPVDERSDVFSIGVVLYEMITRRLPFAGKTTAETLHHITSIEPEPLARFNYELPIELERIVRKCLQKSPDLRYASARDLLADLRTLIHDRSGMQSAPWLRPARPRRLGRAVFPLMLLAIAVLVVSVITLSLRGRRSARGDRAIRSVAVLPFGSRSTDNYIADGLTESLIDHLAEDPNLRVMARSTVFHYLRSSLAPREIARQLNVDAVLTAEMREHNGSLNIVVELVSAKDGARLWGEQFERPASELMSIEQDLAADVARALQIKHSTHEQPAGGLRRSEAHSLYLRGQYAFNKRTAESMNEALNDFERAASADPTYGPPYAALANVLSVLERYSDVPPPQTDAKARAAALKAIRLDADLPEAHVALASIYDTYDWNWAAAESEYRKAIELRPGYALAHQWYALLLTKLGRHEQALREITTALTLDPLSALTKTQVAYVLYYARRFDEALANCARASQLDPQFGPARVLHAVILDQKKQYAAAAAELEQLRARGTSKLPTAALAVTEASAQKSDRARSLLGELDAAYLRAVVESALGDRDAAFADLDRAVESHSSYLAYAKVDPMLDPLRSDPRFAALLERLHLQ